MRSGVQLSLLLGTTLVVGASGPAAGTLPPGPDRAAPLQVRGNTEYDGRFTFVRLRFDPAGFGGFGQAPWAHDYPRADVHLMQILGELTALAPRVDGSNVLATDDQELFKYPFAYICEPGFWSQSEKEAAALRDWLLKGGFLIVDDFRGADMENFQEQMRRVLPAAELLPLDASHPIFHAFFDFETLDFSAPTFRRYKPVFLGVFENNDRTGRLLAVVNYNNDIGDLWEFSDTGWLPVDMSNEAYKLGINYVMYALTH